MAVSVVVSFILLAYLGQVQFSIWGQITALGGADPTNVSPTTAHFLRYALLFVTVIVPSRYLGTQEDWLFSIQVAIMLMATAYFQASLLKMQGTVRGRGWALTAFSVAMVTLSLFMNGRLAYVFFGHSLSLWACAAWGVGVLGLPSLLGALLLGAVCCSVSSGSFCVNVGTLWLWAIGALLWLKPLAMSRRKRRQLSLTIVLSLLPALPLVVIYYRKNVEFYGSLFNMLNHGAGMLFAIIPPALLFLILVVGGALAPPVVLGIQAVLSTRPLRGLAYLSILCSVLLGFFGFSTLMTGLPALMVVSLQQALETYGRSKKLA